MQRMKVIAPFVHQIYKKNMKVIAPFVHQIYKKNMKVIAPFVHQIYKENPSTGSDSLGLCKPSSD